MLQRATIVVVLLFLPLVAQQPKPEELDHSGSEALELELLTLKRVYVESFGGGESAAQVRDMVIASLQRVKLFVLTENPERADAILRGSAEDLVFTDTFQSGESIAARTGISLGRGSSSSRSGRDSTALQASVGESESTRVQERKHEASASVRLVNRDGDVIWSTTQESMGAKFRSASADVAAKITRQLLEDRERMRAGRVQLAR